MVYYGEKRKKRRRKNKMIIKIEELKKSERGIEVTGWVAPPNIDSVIAPIPLYKPTEEEEEARLSKYTAELGEANDKYDRDALDYDRLHLGEAALIQETKADEVEVIE